MTVAAAGKVSTAAPADRAGDLPRPAPAKLTDEQRRQFERDGFLIVPEALPMAMVERLLEVVDRLYEQGCGRRGCRRPNRRSGVSGSSSP